MTVRDIANVRFVICPQFRKLRLGIAFALILFNLVLALPHKAHAQVCEFPPLDEPDNDGDECANPAYDVQKDLGAPGDDLSTQTDPTGQKQGQASTGAAPCAICGASSTDDSSSAVTTAGDPINYAVGNEYEYQVDYISVGPSPLVLSRSYNSMDPSPADNFGLGWRSSYSRSVSGPTPSTPTTTVAKVTRDDGKMFTFTLIAGVWTPDPDVNSRLTELTDSHGAITGWRYMTARDETELYDAQGRLLSVANRAGLTQTVTHDASGRLASVTDPFGRSFACAYASPASVQIAQVTAPDGGIFKYAYSTGGNLLSVTFPDGAVRRFAYGNTSFPNAITAITDEDGNLYTSISYDNQGRATSTSMGAGVETYTVDYTFASLGAISYTNPLGARIFSAFESIGGAPHRYQTQINCADCGYAAATFATYDTNGNLLTATDPRGVLTTYSYDTARNLQTSRTEAAFSGIDRSIATVWNSTFRLPDQIAEPSRTTHFTYDAHGNLLTRTVTAGTLTRSWTFTYNANGQVLTASDPLGHVTHFAYDAKGNLTSITDPLGHVTGFPSHDANGRPLTMKDPNGLVTAFTYDPRSRLTSHMVGTEKTGYAYDAAGNLTKLTRPDGSFLSFTYDTAHRLTGVKDALGNSIAYTLDAANNKIKEQIFDPGNALRQTRSFTYNQLNQLLQQIGAQSQTTSFVFDANSNLTATTDPLGNTYGGIYDALNRLTTETDPAFNTTALSYDANDHLTGITDPRNLQTAYGWNGLDEQTSLTSPDTGAAARTFDAAGNLLTSTDARGDKTTYAYDALNRVISESFSDGKLITFQYDQGAGGIGHLTGVTDATGAVNFTYDQHGRLLTRHQQTGTVLLTTTGAYDAFGRLASMTYPSGRTITYAFDADGRVNAVASSGQSIASAITYQPFGNASGWTQGNGASYSRTIDLDGRIAAITLGGTASIPGSTSLSFTFDNASRITGLLETGLAGKSFAYDALDRLTSFLNGAATTGYAYDADGNRTQTTVAAGNTLYLYGTSSNRLTGRSGLVTETDSYDAAGNLTGDGIHSFTYDARGRLVMETTAGVQTSYGLNGLGQRVSKKGPGITPSGTSFFVYDAAGHLAGEYDASGNATEETVWLGDTPIAVMTAGQGAGDHDHDDRHRDRDEHDHDQHDRDRGHHHHDDHHPDHDRASGGAAVYFIAPDNLNTPHIITDQNGSKVWSWDHLAFGDNAPNQNPSGLGVFAYNLRFPGQYADAESGLSYNYFRDYNPAIGRYIQGDPVGLAGGVNTYGYAEQNPLWAADAKGTISKAAAYNYLKDYVKDQIGEKTFDFFFNINGGSQLPENLKDLAPDVIWALLTRSSGYGTAFSLFLDIMAPGELNADEDQWRFQIMYDWLQNQSHKQQINDFLNPPNLDDFLNPPNGLCPSS
jgi:RHS repeat-associated protein